MTASDASKKTKTIKSVQNAKRAFFVALFDLSWRMLGAMLAPIFIGLWLDSVFDVGGIFALVGFIIGMVGGVLIIRSIIKKLSDRDTK